MTRIEIINITPGQTITMSLGRKTLKNGRRTKGIARNVRVTSLTPGGINGTYKANGLTAEGNWSWAEIEDATN